MRPKPADFAIGERAFTYDGGMPVHLARRASVPLDA
jgi:hypothetical protein